VTTEHLEDLQTAVARARKHLSREEASAADEALKLARSAVGKNVREILEMLNDKELFDRVTRLVKGVPTLKGPDCGCC